MDIKTIFRSSVNPNEISLTVKGVANTVCTIIAAVATINGMDVLPLTDSIKVVADQVIVIITAALTIYHTKDAIYGFARKFMVNK